MRVSHFLPAVGCIARQLVAEVPSAGGEAHLLQLVAVNDRGQNDDAWRLAMGCVRDQCRTVRVQKLQAAWALMTKRHECPSHFAKMTEDRVASGFRGVSTVRGAARFARFNGPVSQCSTSPGHPIASGTVISADYC